VQAALKSIQTITLDSAFVATYLAGFSRTLSMLDEGELQKGIELVLETYHAGKQLFIAGNGGSAATASHMAADFGKTILGQRINPAAKRFRVISLTDNMALMSAYANDVSYDEVFAQQLCTLASPGDMLVVISASGNSPNILRAINAARDLGVETLGLLGFEGGLARSQLDHSIIVRSKHYGYIEDAHGVVMHLFTDALKKAVVERQ
jgi:D-sedoheptulose 7-phosphate isomerase